MSEKKLGRYVIERKLGEGGMGDVYLGFDPEAERMVAVKTIRRELLDHPKKLQRFQREIDLQAKVTHPNVVKILDRGEHNGMQFLVLEYVEGQELADVVPPGGMDVSQASHITERVCLAMHDVHELGIIHRDMKPANVLLDGLGNPHVIDFGVAKSLSGEEEVQLTRDGGFVGTLEYASPEQAEGKLSEVDRRSDIFNLGAMLYKLLTGRTPFFDPKKTDPNELRMRIVTDHPIEPRRVRPEIPQDLENIVLKALAKDRAKRYQTAKEFAADLAKFRAGERVRVAYSLKADKLSQWVGKHKAKIAVVTIFLIALCASTAMYADKLRKDSAARRLAADEVMQTAASKAKQDPVNAWITANRVLLNFPKHSVARNTARAVAPKMKQVTEALNEARIAMAAGEEGKGATALAKAYSLAPLEVTKAGFHFFDGKWLTTPQAKKIGLLDASNQRKRGKFFFGNKWYTRDQAITSGYLLHDQKNDRLLNGAEAKKIGWLHQDGAWMNPKEAMSRGLLYFDAQLGKYLGPREAQERGFTFDHGKKRWLTAKESQAKGFGLMVEGVWYPAADARRQGFRFTGEKWYHLSMAWRKVLRVGQIRCPEQATAIGWGNRATYFALGGESGKLYLYEKRDLTRPQFTMQHGAVEGKPGAPIIAMTWDINDKYLLATDSNGLTCLYEVASRLILLRRIQVERKVLAMRIQVDDGQPKFDVAFRKGNDLRIVRVPQDTARNRVMPVGVVFQAAWAPTPADMLLVNATHLRHYDVVRKKELGKTDMPFGQAEAFVTADFVPKAAIAVAVATRLAVVDPRSGAKLVEQRFPNQVLDVAFDSLGESLLILYRPRKPRGKQPDWSKVVQGVQLQAAGVK